MLYSFTHFKSKQQHQSSVLSENIHLFSEAEAESQWQDITPVKADPGKTLSVLRSFQGLDSMWALSSASGRGRWVWAVWTLTFEPRGHMSLGAIFEAQNYTGELGGPHLKQQWEYRSVSWRSEQHIDVFPLNRLRFSLTWFKLSHPSTLLFFTEFTFITALKPWQCNCQVAQSVKKHHSAKTAQFTTKKQHNFR